MACFALHSTARFNYKSKVLQGGKEKLRPTPTDMMRNDSVARIGVGTTAPASTVPYSSIHSITGANKLIEPNAVPMTLGREEYRIVQRFFLGQLDPWENASGM